MLLHRQALGLSALVLLLALMGCSNLPTAPVAPDADAWQDVPLPGKASTRYTPELKDGRAAVAAFAERAASMWRRRLDMDPATLGEVRFAWWVSALPLHASVADVDREDAAARVLFGFAGDIGKLPQRTRMMFDLAEALTGEQPPYATLMYVWDASAPVGSVIVNPRTDRVRKIVVDSGTQALGRWRDHRRDLQADFKLAFGEPPGRLVSVAVMTDSDNTRSQVRAWYDTLSLNQQALLRGCTVRVQALSGDASPCTHTPATTEPARGAVRATP
jgi:Protein of unknown function (DUF3047)